MVFLNLKNKYSVVKEQQCPNTQRGAFKMPNVDFKRRILAKKEMWNKDMDFSYT